MRTATYKLADKSERNNYQAQYKELVEERMLCITEGQLWSKYLKEQKINPVNQMQLETVVKPGREKGEARWRWGVNRYWRRGEKTGVNERETCVDVIKNRDKQKWQQKNRQRSHTQEEGERDWFTNSGVLSQVHALRQAGCLIATDRTACVCERSGESLTHSPINTHTHTHLGKSDWFKKALSCSRSFYWAVKKTVMW